MRRILLDFSNVRVGGGLLVAAATLQELAEPDMMARYPWLDRNLDIWISPLVAKNFTGRLAELPGTVTVKETTASVLTPLKPARHRYDVRFTLFGPTYTGRLARREIMGFAEVLLIYAPHEFGQQRTRHWRSAISNVVKRHLVKQSDVYVTETAAVADRLARRYGVPRERIEVVPNRPHPFICAQDILMPREQREQDNALHLFYPTRAYPHKNLEIIGEAGDEYAKLTGRRLIVHVTLRDSEWQCSSERTRRYMHNHGEVTPDQLMQIYRQIDAVLFPSLLEASSATPLEANVLGVPLIASDRDFVRASAEASEYFEPTSGISVADALVRFEADHANAWARARKRAEAYRQDLTSGSRTGAYLAIIDRELTSLQSTRSSAADDATRAQGT